MACLYAIGAIIVLTINGSEIPDSKPLHPLRHTTKRGFWSRHVKTSLGGLVAPGPHALQGNALSLSSDQAGYNVRHAPSGGGISRVGSVSATKGISSCFELPRF